MNPEFEIRQATAADVPAIASVFIETRTACLAFLNWEYSTEIMNSVFLAQIARLEFRVAASGNEVVGFVAFDRHEVDHLYVLPRYQGKGIGTELLQKALAQANREFRLWVFQENRQARKFYERHGFALEFETEGENNVEKAPDARYVWRSR